MEKKRTGVIRSETIIEKEQYKININNFMVVGVDPSYNGFGIVVLDQDGKIVEQKVLTSDSKLEPEERILSLEKEFNFIPNIHCLEKVYMEGPSFSSNGAFMLQMGALNYYFRLFLRKKKVDFQVVTPNTLKKFVCKNGKAKKEMMLLHIYKRWGIEFDNNNIADAYGLARMALDDIKASALEK